MSEWQPIETAPKDGTDVLVAYREHVLTAYWSDSIWAMYANPVKGAGGAWIQEENRSDTWAIPATHWMPLPPPPVQS